MPSRSAKKVTAIELSDGDLSDSSIVYVKSGVAPKTKPATKVAAFGDITSDDEVVVVEKKRKPSLTRSESSSPTKSARIAGSSSRQPASSPDGKVRSPAVRDLTEGRPLKLETRDPRPPVTPPRRSVPSNESPTKRPQRTPKPTEKAKYNANTPTTSLAERLDRLTQRDESPEVAEEESDSSYRPAVKRPCSTRAFSRCKMAASSAKKANDKSSDIKALESAFNERSRTASEDELPSPGSILKRAGPGGESKEFEVDRGRPVSRPAKIPFDNRGSSVESVAGSPDEDASVPVREDKGKGRALENSSAAEVSTVKPKRESVEWDYDALAGLEDDSGDRTAVAADSSSPMDVDPSAAEGESQPVDEGCLKTSIPALGSLTVLFAADEAALPPLLDAERIHPSLVNMYGRLPWLHNLKRCNFTGFGRSSGIYDDFEPISYGSVLDSVDNVTRKKLKRSMGFVSSPPVFNPVRQSMEGFVRGWNCLSIPASEGPGNAIWALTGICVGSHLSQPAVYGDDRSWQIHIQPFENDWEIYQANIGTFYESELCHVPGRADALVFSSKKQSFPAQKAKPDTSAKPGTSSLKSKPYSPVKGASSSSARKSKPTNVLHPRGPAYRLYDEGIPVFDGRSLPGTMGFKFDSESWQTYESLPRYPRSEVAINSLVTVAHTIHGFLGDKAKYHTVLLHTLFVIVLGEVPLGDEESGDAE